MQKKRKFQGKQNTSEQSTAYTSTSAKKLRDSKSLNASYFLAIDYVFLCFTHFFFTLSNFVKCNACDGQTTFAKTYVKGLGFQIQLRCKCSTDRVIDSFNRISSD